MTTTTTTTAAPPQARSQWRTGMQLLRAQLRHELQMRYVGSLAGAYWALINPLVQVGVYVVLVTVIFKARLHGIGPSRFDYVIFVLAGMSGWLAMQEGIVMSSSSLTRHADIVKNVIFPLELLPLTAVLVSLISMGVSMTVLAFFVAISGFSVGWSLVCFPLLLLLQVALTLGAGLVLSIVTAFVRDMGLILPILLQFVTLMTPILYSIASMPPFLRTLTRLNPIYHLVQSYRAIFVAGVWPSAGGLLYVGDRRGVAARPRSDGLPCREGLRRGARLMRVLVTGANGFVGRRLLETHSGGHELVALARTRGPELPGVEWIEHDLVEPLADARLPDRIDAVIHLAQSRRYREFPEGARDVFEVNTRSTFELLEYARRAGARSFVFASTGGVYGVAARASRRDRSRASRRASTSLQVRRRAARRELRGVLLDRRSCGRSPSTGRGRNACSCRR